MNSLTDSLVLLLQVSAGALLSERVGNDRWYFRDTVRGLMKLMNSDTVGPCNIGMPKYVHPICLVTCF